MLYKISSYQDLWPAAIKPVKPAKPKGPVLSAPKMKKAPQGRVVNYTDLLSKTTPKMSDEEFLDAAKEQAQMDFANGVYQGPEFGALQNGFVSVVSPDRRGLVRNAFNLSQQARQQNEQYQYPYQPSYAPAPQSTGEIFVYDSASRPVASYIHGQGWTEVYTPEEAARKQTILRTYNDTWMALHRAARAEGNRFDQMTSDLGVGAYDAEG